MNPPTASANTLVPLSYAPLNPADVPEYQHAQAAAATASAALSQDRSAEANIRAMTTTTTAGIRKRKSNGIPGSRGVANLTPDQLAKKRANDREAQRAIRERTRNTIETLEKRIRELESQQPYQELQRMIAERDRALAECEQLKRRLGAVAGIVGGGHPSLNELANLTAQQSPLPSVAHSTHPYAPPTPASYESQSQLIHSEHHSPHPVSHTTPSSLASPPSHTNQNVEQSLRKWSPGVHKTQASTKSSTNSVHYEQQDAPPAPALQRQTSGERHGLSFLLDTPQQQARHPSPAQISSYGGTPHTDPPDYSRLTNVGEATCTLDAVLKDFHTRRRGMLREGVSSLEAIGPEQPSYSTLLNLRADPRVPHDDHSISAIIIQIVHKFPDIIGLPEQAAILHVMFLITRWLVCPCQRCYERLPVFSRPIQEQFDIPHAAWLDYLPWPNMRRKFLTTARDIKFEDFFVPYTTTLSLNWTLPPECVFLPPPPGEPLGASGEPVLNPLFEAHLYNLDNWVVGPAFEKEFPDLVDGTVVIKQ